MIASSLKEGEGLMDLLLSKDADVNIKSMSLPFLLYTQTTRKLTMIKFRL